MDDHIHGPPLPYPEPPLADAVAALIAMGAALSHCAAIIGGVEEQILAEGGDPGVSVHDLLTRYVGSLLGPVAARAGKKQTASVADWLHQAVDAVPEGLFRIAPPTAT